MYGGKHSGEYHEYRLLVNYFVGYHSNGHKSVKSEVVMGEETLTGTLGNVGGTVKTRTLGRARVRHPEPAEDGLRDSARSNYELLVWARRFQLGSAGAGSSGSSGSPHGVVARAWCDPVL